MQTSLEISLDDTEACKEFSAFIQELLDIETIAYTLEGRAVSLLRWETPSYFKNMTVAYVESPSKTNSFQISTFDNHTELLREILDKHLGQVVTENADVEVSLRLVE